MRQRLASSGCPRSFSSSSFIPRSRSAHAVGKSGSDVGDVGDGDDGDDGDDRLAVNSSNHGQTELLNCRALTNGSVRCSHDKLESSTRQVGKMSLMQGLVSKNVQSESYDDFRRCKRAHLL